MKRTGELYFLRACNTLRFVPLHKTRAPTAWSQLNVSMHRVVTVFSPLPFSVNWAHTSHTTDRALLFSERRLYPEPETLQPYAQSQIGRAAPDFTMREATAAPRLRHRCKKLGISGRSCSLWRCRKRNRYLKKRKPKNRSLRTQSRKQKQVSLASYRRTCRTVVTQRRRSAQAPRTRGGISGTQIRR